MSSSGYEPSAKLPHHVEQISLPCPLNGCHGKWKSKYIQVEQGNQPALHWWSGFKLGLKLGYFHSKCWVSNCGTERITRVHCKVVGQRDAQFIAGALVPQYNISFDQSTPAAPLPEFVQNMLKGPGNHITPTVNSLAYWMTMTKNRQSQANSQPVTLSGWLNWVARIFIWKIASANAYPWASTNHNSACQEIMDL